jgi:predicted negative regulator of RcsB-dependent stress response
MADIEGGRRLTPYRLNPPSWLRRHDTALLVAALLIAVALVVAYQFWSQHQSDSTQSRITRSASTCGQVDRLYTDLLQVMAHEPSFTQAQVRAMVLQRRDRLLAQGCS